MNRQTEGGADYSGRKLKYNVQAEKSGKRSIMARLEQRRKVCENLPICRKTSYKFFERMGGIRDDEVMQVREAYRVEQWRQLSGSCIHHVLDDLVDHVQVQGEHSLILCLLGVPRRICGLLHIAEILQTELTEGDSDWRACSAGRHMPCGTQGKGLTGT